jgi:hypothetical protein
MKKIIFITILILIFPTISIGCDWISIKACSPTPIRTLNSGGVKYKALDFEFSHQLSENIYLSGVAQPFLTEYNGVMIPDLSLSARIKWREYLLNNLFLDLFGGLGVRTSGYQPEIGYSGAIGHFGGSIVFKFSEINLSYGLSRWSDPLNHGDKGHNYQMFGIEVPF